MSKLKNVGGVLAWIVGFAVLTLIPFVFILGAGFVGTIVMPWLPIANWLAIITCILLLPFAMFKRTRAAAGIGYLIASYAFGTAAWFCSFFLSYYYWGLTGLLIGLAIIGIGVVPVALLALFFHGAWAWFVAITVMAALTFGVRFAAFWCSVHAGSNQQSRAPIKTPPPHIPPRSPLPNIGEPFGVRHPRTGEVQHAIITGYYDNNSIASVRLGDGLQTWMDTGEIDHDRRDLPLQEVPVSVIELPGPSSSTAELKAYLAQLDKDSQNEDTNEARNPVQEFPDRPGRPCGSELDVTDGSAPCDSDTPPLKPAPTLERSMKRLRALEYVLSQTKEPLERHKMIGLIHRQKIVIARYPLGRKN